MNLGIHEEESKYQVSAISTGTHEQELSIQALERNAVEKHRKLMRQIILSFIWVTFLSPCLERVVSNVFKLLDWF